MDPLECRVCFERFDEIERRPRILPCGHHFCTHCLLGLIKEESIQCPTCRQIHITEEVSSLPINFGIEEILNFKAKEEISVERKPKAAPRRPPRPSSEAFSHELCAEHGYALNFRCLTHNKWVCRDCTVIEHTKDKCDIIGRKQALSKQKAISIADLDQRILSIQDMIQNLLGYSTNMKLEQGVHEELVREMGELVLRHQESSQRLQVQEGRAQIQLEEAQDKLQQLQDYKDTVTSAQLWIEVENASEGAKDFTDSLIKWQTLYNVDILDWNNRISLKELQDFRGKVDVMGQMFGKPKKPLRRSASLDSKLSSLKLNNKKINRLSMIPDIYSSEMIQMKTKIVEEVRSGRTNCLYEYLRQSGNDGDHVYAKLLKDGCERYGKLLVHNNKIMLSALSPGCSLSGAVVLPMASLQQLISPSAPEVYMALTHESLAQIHMGTLDIRVKGAVSFGQQFLSLCLGTHGGSWRGSRIAGVWRPGQPGEYLWCEEYITDRGEHSKVPIMTGLERGMTSAMDEGMVGVYGAASFRIVTHGNPSSFTSSIGRVTSGLNLLKDAITRSYITDVVIDDVGVYIPIR